MDEIFDSAVRSKNDFAGVFESNDETSYFYLYDLNANDGRKIIAAIHVASKPIKFDEADVSVAWNGSESAVGVLLKNVLWAVFEVDSQKKFGGDYSTLRDPKIPSEIVKSFVVH
jgi:hypothetical protein